MYRRIVFVDGPTIALDPPNGNKSRHDQDHRDCEAAPEGVEPRLADVSWNLFGHAGAHLARLSDRCETRCLRLRALF